MNRQTAVFLQIGVFVFVANLALGQNCPINSSNSAPSTSSMMQKWTADNGPYKILERMKEEFQQGKSPHEITQEYKALAQMRPSDPAAQLAYIASQRGEFMTTMQNASLPSALLQALTKSDPGNSYEYARYQFCMTDEADETLPTEQVKKIGGRLLAYNPKDNWVRLSLIHLLGNSEEGINEVD